MKKILLSMLMLVAMLPAFAADYTITFSTSVRYTISAGHKMTGVEQDDEIITAYGNADNASKATAGELQIGGISDGYVEFKLGHYYNVKSIKLSNSQYGLYKPDITLSAGSYSQKYSYSSSLTFDEIGEIDSFKIASTRAFYLTKIEIDLEKVDSEFKFDESPYTLYLSDYVDGISYVTNTFTCKYGASSVSDVTFSSNNESVATVNEYGEASPLHVGSTQIVASIPESNKQYFAGDFSYTLNVELFRPTEEGSATHAPLVYMTDEDGNETLMTNSAMNDLTADLFKFHFVTGSTIYYRFSNKQTYTSPSDIEFDEPEDETTTDSENAGYKEMTSTDDGTTVIGSIDRANTDAEDVDTTTLEVYAVKDGVKSNSIFLNFSLPTGVEEIASENNAEAAYYTLHGVRVANPEKGLYIRVRGSKADKVLF